MMIKLAWPRLTNLNAALGRALLALWPEENKSWGVAFTSEPCFIESPLMQFRWLLGGIAILLREAFHSFLSSLGRPIGVDSCHVTPKPGRPNGRAPHTPRFIIALLFLLVAVLMALPETRTVFRSVSQAYTEAGWDPSRWPEVQRIQALAEQALRVKNPDPQLLAFASLTFADENKRLAFADAAIRIEPALAWIDYQNAILPWGDVAERHSLSSNRIDRLLAADPGNAVLHLQRADSVALPFRQEDARNDPGAQHIGNWIEQVSHDQRWLAAMDAAFRAPRYDAYDAKVFRLSQNVMQRYSVDDPRILLSLPGRRPINQHLEIRTYAQILLARAANSPGGGNRDSAIATCWLILDFAQRLRAGNFYRLEAWIANDLESQALPLLQSSYENSGRPTEARNIAARLRQNRNERVLSTSEGRRGLHGSVLGWSRLEWAAVFMQSSVFAISVLLPWSLATIALLWFWRSRLRVTTGLIHSLLCQLSDVCPPLLALATVILFVSYAPYDLVYRQTLHAPFSPAAYQRFIDAASAPFSLPNGAREALESLIGPQGSFLLRSALAAALSLLVLSLSWRLVRKRSVSSEQ